jgi:hypothetical protein
MIRRFLVEYNQAKSLGHLDVASSKVSALRTFYKYGFQETFKESLTPRRRHFRSRDEHARFNFCEL